MGTFFRRGCLVALLLICAVCAVCAARAQAPGASRRWVESEETHRVALVIGNAAYLHGPPLKNPTNDADAVAASLRRLGFAVIEIRNGTRREMIDGIDAFGDKLNAESVALVYYSGHGMQVDGENYLLPVDFNAKKRGEVEFDGVAAGRILAQFAERKSPINIVVLDACRDNPFSAFSRSSQTGLAQMRAPHGTLIAYATSPGSTADDNSDGSNGLYTTQFLKALPTPGVTVEQMFKIVRQGVAESSGGMQVPWDESSILGDLYLSHAAPSNLPKVPALATGGKPSNHKPGALMTQANFLMGQGKYQQTRTLAQTSLAANPDDYEALTVQALACIGLKDSAQALDAVEHALTLNPNYAEAYACRGFVDISQKNTAGGMSDFNKAIELDPRNAEFHVDRGMLYGFQENNRQALADYTKAIELDPKNVSAYNDRGSLYAAQGDEDKAIADFSKSIENGTTNVIVRYNRGILYSHRNNVKSALADFRYYLQHVDRSDDSQRGHIEFVEQYMQDNSGQ